MSRLRNSAIYRRCVAFKVGRTNWFQRFAENLPVLLKCLWQTWRFFRVGRESVVSCPWVLPRPEWTDSTLSASERHGENFTVKSTQTLSTLDLHQKSNGQRLHRDSCTKHPDCMKALKAADWVWSNGAHPFILTQKQKVRPGVSQSCLDNLDSWARFTDLSVWLLQLRRGKPNSRTPGRLSWQVGKFLYRGCCTHRQLLKLFTSFRTEPVCADVIRAPWLQHCLLKLS